MIVMRISGALQNLGLEKVGVKMTKNGAIEVVFLLHCTSAFSSGFSYCGAFFFHIVSSSLFP